MKDEEIKETSGVIIMVGSETSATLLTGALYYLLKNPFWLSKVQNEVRPLFVDEAQITFSSVSQLKMLNAVINETLRLYPPFPIYLPRVTPKEGATVAGTYIPPDTIIGIPHYATYRSGRHFKNAERYAPERFMGDEEYAKDNRSVFQPFSVGPRNCIGQNLAWAEIRAILTRLLWHFDFEMLKTSKDWEKQGAFVLWSKPSLMVKLKVRKH
jgi:cytochrome P450